MKQPRLLFVLMFIIVLVGMTACAAPTQAPAPTTAPAAATSVPATKAPAPTSAPAAAATSAPATKAPEATKPPAPTTAPAGAQPVKGGTLVVSHGVNCSDSLNQHTSSHTPCRMVAHHVLDTLVAVNPKNGSVVPSLALSWDISSDGKVYTFKLRNDVKFHDGTPFNAQAVKYNFDYTIRPDVPHKFAWSAIGADQLEKTEVVDEFTVKVTFKSAYPSFLINLSDGGLGIDSPTAMEKAGKDYGFKTLVGTGPFIFKEWVKDDHITLVRNDNYKWAPSIFNNKGTAYLDQIIYRDVADNATRAAALEANEVQVATLTESQTVQFKNNKDVQILTTPKAGTTRMYLMNAAKSPTDDLRVRQAINHAIDKKALLVLPAWSGIGYVGLAPLPANMVPNNDLSTLKQYDYSYDQAKAKQLLDDAGWKVGSDGIREKGGQKMIIDMVTTATSVPQIEPIDQMLRQVGIKLNIRTGDTNFWLNTVDKKDFGMTLMSDSGYNGPALIVEFFYTKSAYNSYGYSNAQVDQYLEKALNAPSQKVVWENMMPAMAQIMKDAVGVMGWEQLYIYGASAKLRDVGYNEIGFPFFYDTWIGK
jgi:peptide/nickel transport system substrate-binding protein